MKILSIIDSKTAYGKERANLEVAHIMSEQGAHIKIVINKIADASIRNEVSSFDYTEIPFPRNLGGKKNFLLYIWFFLQAQIKVTCLFQKEKADYILLPTEIALAYLYFPLCFSRAKKIFRCGDSPLIYRKNGMFAKIYGIIWKYIILRNVDTIVCNAKFIQNQIIESGRHLNAKDVIIYNYPPKREVKLDDAKYNKHEGVLRLGFMGRIVEDKGVKELIRAVRLINKEAEKVIVYICGDSSLDIDYTNELKRWSDKSIEFVGEVNNIEKFYDNIDIVVIPSIYPEPMANVVTEAKYHQKAVIIFNLGGMPEIVEHKKNGYICKDVNVECLAEAIQYYLDNPNYVKKHGESAYESIEKMGLTKDIFMKKWAEVFSMPQK